MIKSKSAFTLVELLVVVLIITILATVVGVNLSREPGKAKMAATSAQFEIFRVALSIYRFDQGRLPTQEQGLKALCEKPRIPPVPEHYPEQEGYLESRTVPLDQWGNQYVYLVPGSKGERYEIISYGADGEPGGEGENADRSSSDR